MARMGDCFFTCPGDCLVRTFFNTDSPFISDFQRMAQFVTRSIQLPKSITICNLFTFRKVSQSFCGIGQMIGLPSDAWMTTTILLSVSFSWVEIGRSLIEIDSC